MTRRTHRENVVILASAPADHGFVVTVRDMSTTVLGVWVDRDATAAVGLRAELVLDESGAGVLNALDVGLHRPVGHLAVRRSESFAEVFTLAGFRLRFGKEA